MVDMKCLLVLAIVVAVVSARGTSLSASKQNKYSVDYDDSSEENSGYHSQKNLKYNNLKYHGTSGVGSGLEEKLTRDGYGSTADDVDDGDNVELHGSSSADRARLKELQELAAGGYKGTGRSSSYGDSDYSDDDEVSGYGSSNKALRAKKVKYLGASYNKGYGSSAGYDDDDSSAGVTGYKSNKATRYNKSKYSGLSAGKGSSRRSYSDDSNDSDNDDVSVSGYTNNKALKSLRAKYHGTGYSKGYGSSADNDDYSNFGLTGYNSNKGVRSKKLKYHGTGATQGLSSRTASYDDDNSDDSDSEDGASSGYHGYKVTRSKKAKYLGSGSSKGYGSNTGYDDDDSDVGVYGSSGYGSQGSTRSKKRYNVGKSKYSSGSNAGYGLGSNKGDYGVHEGNPLSRSGYTGFEYPVVYRQSPVPQVVNKGYVRDVDRALATAIGYNTEYAAYLANLVNEANPEVAERLAYYYDQLRPAIHQNNFLSRRSINSADEDDDSTEVGAVGGNYGSSSGYRGQGSSGKSKKYKNYGVSSSYKGKGRSSYAGNNAYSDESGNVGYDSDDVGSTSGLVGSQGHGYGADEDDSAVSQGKYSKTGQDSNEDDDSDDDNDTVGAVEGENVDRSALYSPPQRSNGLIPCYTNEECIEACTSCRRAIPVCTNRFCTCRVL